MFHVVTEFIALQNFFSPFSIVGFVFSLFRIFSWHLSPVFLSPNSKKGRLNSCARAQPTFLDHFAMIRLMIPGCVMLLLLLLVLLLQYIEAIDRENTQTIAQ